MKKEFFRKSAYVAMAISFFVLPWIFPAFEKVASGLAVVSGLLFAVLLGNPFAPRTARMASPLLGMAIVMMGFGLEIGKILQTAAQSIGYTAVGIAIAFSVGIAVGRWLKLERDTCLLISSGTAICGGSAIAAVAPVLGAKAYSVAIATAVVFILNAVALLIFPPIGHYFNFSPEQFGLWSAVAIHDTSSVVGAAMQYEEPALDIATTVKLTRALWIVPVAFIISLAISRGDGKGGKAKIKVPWFIPGFLLAAALIWLFKGLAPAGKIIGGMSKYLMVATLFLIGSNVSVDKIRELGFRPILHGIILWVFLLTMWFLAIYFLPFNSHFLA